MPPGADRAAVIPERVGAVTGAAARPATRDFFSRCAATVNLITVRDGNVASGMTATSVCSLSLDPPSALICVNREARTRAAIAAAESFVISVLSQDQEEVANLFSRPGGNKTIPETLLSDDPVLDGIGPEFPVLDGVAGALMCRLQCAVDFGSHSIMIGLVEAVYKNEADPQPLVYHDRRYVSTVANLGIAWLQDGLDASSISALGW
ncbi:MULTISPECIES: flavin reductase family protein [Nocardioides]|uniref:Flavin reductase family protein n=1 Tax=Nocardioides vastitatis TaxID=2568655 RepID=A0ABW0ZH32_9ACTN|nr:flavin reductase family protein [Nocardioides sp.]